MPPAGFKPTIPAGERPQTYVLDREAKKGLISYPNLCEYFQDRRYLCNQNSFFILIITDLHVKYKVVQIRRGLICM